MTLYNSALFVIFGNVAPYDRHVVNASSNVDVKFGIAMKYVKSTKLQLAGPVHWASKWRKNIAF